MDRLVLSDGGVERMAPPIIGRPDQKVSLTGATPGCSWRACRIVRTGFPGVDLSQAFGDEQRVPALQPMEPQGGLAADSWRCPDDPDFEYLIIDSTHRAGASARRRGEKRVSRSKAHAERRPEHEDPAARLFAAWDVRCGSR